MANTSTDRPGIMTWVSAIRTTMANDPGRQLLEDQIQTSGFLFLEDYLESILTRPRHDPIIELVKTPARRRDAPKMTWGGTAAASKARPIGMMDLDEVGSDKENDIPPVTARPINAFHKTLLHAKDANSEWQRQQPSTDVLSTRQSSFSPYSSKKAPIIKNKVAAVINAAPEEVLTDEGEDEDEHVVEKLLTPPRLRTLAAENHTLDPPEPLQLMKRADQLAESLHHGPTTELSVIAEDDEPAESSMNSSSKSICEGSARRSLSLDADATTNKQAKSSKAYPKKTPPKIDMMTVLDIEDLTQTTNFTITSTSAESFQTVPLDSYTGSNTDTSANGPGHSGGALRIESPRPRPSAPHDVIHVAPFPTVDLSNKRVPGDQLTEEAGVKKPRASEYPTIGPPSPLRKSFRAPKESLLPTTHAHSAAKSSAARSSWLVKTREAKFMEENTKKLIGGHSSSHHQSAGSKRKSGEMLGTEQDSLEHHDLGRTQKLTKTIETSPVLSTLKEQEMHPFGHLRDETVTILDDEVREKMASINESDGMIDKLKKTVAGFSARAGRSMGKSLGGAAATALAEARAAAEAKIAERNAAEGRVLPAAIATVSHEPAESKVLTPETVFTAPSEPQQAVKKRCSNKQDRRLSVSDLVSKYDTKKSKEAERVFQPPPPEQSKATIVSANDSSAAANTSTSTTPPNSPPKARAPIFTLPEKPKLPLLPTFFPPPSTQTFSRLESQPFPPSRVPQPLSSHSTFLSTQSTYTDSLFDNEMPPWVPFTQDTDFSDIALSQNVLRKNTNQYGTEPETDVDADESWHLDEKFGETWTPVVMGMKDDSMTWSTAPTRSTRSADTGVLDASIPLPPPVSSEIEGPLDAKRAAFEAIPSDNPPCTSDEVDEEDMDMELDGEIASIRLVTPAAQNSNNRSSSIIPQLQKDSDASANNAGGFFSSASKLVSSVLGGSKKSKEPVKSLQLAAAAAKKQQQEVEKKTNRLKEMEARRQQVLQKKSEEDKAREERRAKEETERWKREKEKEDTTEKRGLRQPGKKLDEDPSKKRKVAEMEKKTESKKPTSKDKKGIPPTKIGKFVPTSSQSGVDAPVVHSKTVKQSTTTTTVEASVSKNTHAPSESKSALAAKAKDKMKEADVVSKPSHVVQSQMQARYQAQLDDSRKVQMPPPASTELIELPDINSEYSDSDDENRVRTFDPPNWAQSPELREALQSQSTVNPDDIFGAIRPLKMEELFKNRTSRFRARTSSANWAGPDELTVHEEREYAKRMGYRR